MASITLKDLPDPLMENMRQRAEREGRSMQEMVRRLLAETYSDTAPAVVWWLDVSKLGRVGEIVYGDFANEDTADDVPDCSECHLPMDRPFVALMSDGTLYGPVCSRCGISE